MSLFETILMVFIGIMSALFLTAVFWWANKPSGTTTVNWANFAGYAIVGAIFGAYSGYTGGEISIVTITTVLTESTVIILFIDQLIAGWLKVPAATMMLKYTGHTFYPVFTLELNDGTVQTFNTATTGRCCAIGVSMPQKTQNWDPGFKVVPAFIDGSSPLDVALTITTGRNQDLSAIKSVKVDWTDGTIDTIPLEMKNGNPVGVAKHHFVFNGN